MYIIRFALISVLLINLPINAFAGGPWTQQKGKGIHIAGLSEVIYQTMSSSTGSGIELPRRVTDISFQHYAEYGLTDRLTIIGNLNVKYVGSSQKTFGTNDFISTIPSGKLFGLGNSSLGFKGLVNEKAILISASFTTEFPSLGDRTAEGLRTGYEDWSFIPQVHFGNGYTSGIYFFVEGGFVFHTKLSDEWRLNGEFGYRFKKRSLIMALNISVKESLKNRTVIESVNYRHTGLYLNDEEFIAWSFKFVHELSDKMGINYAFAGGFRTELIARTPVISVGFYHKFGGNKDSGE